MINLLLWVLAALSVSTPVPTLTRLSGPTALVMAVEIVQEALSAPTVTVAASKASESGSGPSPARHAQGRKLGTEDAQRLCQHHPRNTGQFELGEHQPEALRQPLNQLQRRNPVRCLDHLQPMQLQHVPCVAPRLDVVVHQEHQPAALGPIVFPHGVLPVTLAANVR